MLKNIIYIIIASVFASFLASCNYDNMGITKRENAIHKTVNLEQGKLLELAIENGNGNYALSYGNEGVVAAEVDSNKLKIRGMKEGAAILTLTDGKNRVVNVKVNVNQPATDSIPSKVIEGNSLAIHK